MHHAITPAKGHASLSSPRVSTAPKAMPSPTLSALASISAASTLPALALPPAVLSWAFALATLHAAVLVLLVRLYCYALCCREKIDNIDNQRLTTMLSKISKSNTTQMALAPRATFTATLASRAEAALFPLCLLYLALLVTSWSPDTMSVLLPGSLAEGLAGGRFNPQFCPALTGVAELFSRPATAASVWVHLLVINLFAARSIWARKFLKKMEKSERAPVAHSVLLAGVAAPLGLLADAATRAVCGSLLLSRRPRVEEEEEEEEKPAPSSSAL